MKISRIITMVLISVMLLLMDFGCTGNPFWSDDVISGSNPICGSVVLSDGSNPEGAYVWFEGFNIGTRTDENGWFQITLPPQASQGAQGGLSGVFNLYFYVANYRLARFTVVVQKGLFCYSHGDIDKNGELIGGVNLIKLLDINTKVTPSRVDTGFVDDVSVEITMRAKSSAPVSVVFPKLVENRLGTIFLRKLGSDEITILSTRIAGIVVSDQILIARSSSYTLTMFFRLRAGSYPIGEYEIIPYLLIEQDDFPYGLLKSIGEDVTQRGVNYLQIPFKRDEGRFEITSVY